MAAPLPPDPLLSTLHRMRFLLGVDSASLARSTAGRLQTLATAGSTQLLNDLQPLQQQALQHDGPLVLADTAASEMATPRARFFAGMVLARGAADATLLLSLVDHRPRSPATAHQLAALAIEVTAAATIARQDRRIAALQSQMEQRERLFDRASQAARIGVWSCDLADESLTWTDSVYDLFELPRGSTLDRGATADRYTPQSRQVMEAARARAIADGTDFCIDVEIITAKGTRRWVRLTGSVELQNGVATRIFGMKQDITEEKLLSDRTRYLAETDVMTGLANRSQFQSRLLDLDGSQSGMPVHGLLLVDLDGFKLLNDTHGHAMGDACLREAAARLKACCGPNGLVARIGGDEFAVLAGPDLDPAGIEALAQRVVQAIGQPFACDGQQLALSASVGVAHHRNGTGDDLFRQADFALYAAKAAGRNTSRVHSD